MTNHQRYSHRSTLFVVLLLLVMALQVPDLWWRDVATFSFYPLDGVESAAPVSSSPPQANRSRPKFRKKSQLRRGYRLDTSQSEAAKPIQTEATPTVTDKKQPARIPKSEPTTKRTFRFASWSNGESRSTGSIERQADAEPEPVTPYPPVQFAKKVKKVPTRDGEGASRAVLRNKSRQRGALPYESSTVEAMDSAQSRLSPLDVPEQNLLEPESEADQPADSQFDPTTETAELLPRWERADSLIRQFDELRRLHCNQRVAGWIDDCVIRLESMPEIASIQSKESVRILNQLKSLSLSPVALKPETGSLTDDAHVRRAAYSLDRRCQVWTAVRSVTLLENSSSATDSTPRITQAVQDINKLFDGSTADHRNWHSYLRLDELLALERAGTVANLNEKQDIARDVLNRMFTDALEQEQVQFLKRPEFDVLQSELDVWSADPFDPRIFLLSVESFEATPNDDTASSLLEQSRNLRRLARASSGKSAHQQLASTIETHYRNANVRVAVSGLLLNQLLPVIRPIQEPVSENFLGAKVSGQNQTWTKLAVELVPDANRINIRLNASGTTESQTVSKKGPVRLFSRSNGWFRAGIPIFMHKRGVGTSTVSANASGGQPVVDVRTDYDRIPILGWLIRQLAIGEHQDNRNLVQRHVRNKMTKAAENRLNEVVQERLGQTRSVISKKVIEPLNALDVDVKALEMKTDKQRVTMRCRLAGPDQLSAFTARPRAIAGSVFSMQMHQSTINNIVQQMDLAGQRIELEELIERLRNRLGVARHDIHSDIPENVQIRLADGQPLSVEFDGDRVLVAISIAELVTPRRTYRNFVVRARYTADVDDLNLNLVRDGGIELISEKIGFRDQFALRGIFTKVMANDHRMKILRGRFDDDPRLARLVVNQFTVQDGWIGISVGEPTPGIRAALKSHAGKSLVR